MRCLPVFFPCNLASIFMVIGAREPQAGFLQYCGGPAVNARIACVPQAMLMDISLYMHGMATAAKSGSGTGTYLSMQCGLGKAHLARVVPQIARKEALKI